MAGGATQQSLAAEFLTTQSWIVTDVQGWIDPSAAGNVTFVIYSDGGDIPCFELFSQALNIPGGGATGWFGPSGLSWLLPAAGSYWAAFEVRPGSTFSGTMPSPSPSPLLNEAFTQPYPNYVAFDGLKLGVRIFADDPNATEVPEPTSLLLFGTGAAALIATVGRRKKRQEVH